MSLKFNKKPFVYATEYNFLVVGCGGTGAYLVRDLARIISINNEKYDRKDFMTLVDGDDVELKNLARQNFVESDVGKMKSDVLAKRYSRAFGIRIDSFPSYINKDNIQSVITIRNAYDNDVPNTNQYIKDTATVIIGCVDNNNTRKLLEDFYWDRYTNDRENLVLLDSGNEELGGQVVFATRRILDPINRRKRAIKEKILPPVRLFEMEVGDKHPEDLSCAERAESAPQNIGTNIMAGNILFNYCNQLLAGSSMYEEILRLYYQGDEPCRVAGFEDAVDMLKKRVKELPLIPAHVFYFNSKTGAISAQPFTEAAQGDFYNF